MSRPMIGFLPSITEANLSDYNDNDPPLYCPAPCPIEPVVSAGISQNNMPFPMSTLTIISDVDHKIGLTPTQKEEIVEALLQVKRSLEPGEVEMKLEEFLNAKRKLIQLLDNAQPRLTDTERDEFLNEAEKTERVWRQLEQIRRSQREEKWNGYQEEQRRIKEQEMKWYNIQKMRILLRHIQLNDFEDTIDNCYCDFWSILFKLLQLVMIILAFAKNNQLVASHALTVADHKNTSSLLLLFTILSFFTIIITTILFIFYIMGKVPSPIMYKIECEYCVICIIVYYCATFIQSWKVITMAILGFGAMIGYALDIIRIYCRVRNTTNSSTARQIPRQQVNNLPLSDPVNQHGSYHPSCRNLTSTISDNNYHVQRYAILQTVQEEN